MQKTLNVVDNSRESIDQYLEKTRIPFVYDPDKDPRNRPGKGGAAQPEDAFGDGQGGQGQGSGQG